MAMKSVTRLLAERKGLEARIRSASVAPFIAAQRGDVNPQPVGYVGKTVEQVKTAVKANLDKAKALISYHTRITAALIKSNAETTVTIGGQTMSVAAAIERKSSIAYEKTLLAQCLHQAQRVASDIESANANVEVAIERQLVSLYGGEKAKVVTPEQRKEAAKAINDVQHQAVINPNNLADFVTEQMEALHQFEIEVDFALSEINAKTEIEIADENEVVKVEKKELAKVDMTDPNIGALAS